MVGFRVGKGEGSRAGLLRVLVRAIGAASRIGLAVWMPWPPPLLSGNPSVPVTFLFHP